MSSIQADNNNNDNNKNKNSNINPLPNANQPRRRSSFFDWAFSFGNSNVTTNTNNANSAFGSPINNSSVNAESGGGVNEPAYSHHRSRSDASDSSITGYSGSSLAGIFNRPRANSMSPQMRRPSISPDEALNLSRAGSTYKNSNTNPNFNTSNPVPDRQTSKSPPHPQRKRAGSTYKDLGVVTAYSGGPSSF